VDVFGIRLIGINEETGHKLLLTLAVIAAVHLIRLLVIGVTRSASQRHYNDRVMFWTRQGTSLAAFVIIALAVVSIWFDDPARLSTAMGFVAAGLAFSLQRVITAFVGYLIIMRGKTFTVGDRIKMGGVRGDVVAMGFLQTRILEMGQPANVAGQEEPGMWVRARQFSGRVVTVTNDKIFDEPVFNYTREFPFIWEELTVPVPYRADRELAEQILLRAADEARNQYGEIGDASRARLEREYGIRLDDTTPRVFLRLTDNWLEMTVRFLTPEHGIRPIKDAMTRAILREFDAAGIAVASATFEVVGLPPLRMARGETRRE
jgi:small-conductance mechanosensitive channel